MNGKWTEERDNQLRHLVELKYPGPKIAEIMGLTRGQVSGRAGRLGLKFGGVRGGQNVKPTRRGPKPKPIPKAEPPVPIEVPPLEPADRALVCGVTFANLKRNHCRWYDVHSKLYCGQPTAGYKESYCIGHRLLVRVPRQVRKTVRPMGRW